MTTTVITAGDATNGVSVSSGNDNTIVLQTGPSGSKVNAVSLASSGAATFAQPLADPSVTSINGGQLAGLRNRIINGKMDIAQRGTSFAAIAAGAYSLDRWAFGNTSAAVITASQQADVPSSNEFQSSLRLTVTTADASIAAGDACSTGQFIEGYNVRDLIGKTFTVSFWVRSSKTGVHCVALRSAVNDRSYVAEYTISAANTWEQKSITVSGGLITAGTWDWTNGTGLRVNFTLTAGSTFQTTAGAWQTGSYLATANQVNCLDTIGNIFAITGVQLEVGSVATPFEHRPYGMELALCQRYCQSWISGGIDWIGSNANAGQNNTFSVPIQPMRIAGTWSNPSFTMVNGSIVISLITTNYLLFTVTNTAAGQWRATSSAAATLTAEL